MSEVVFLMKDIEYIIKDRLRHFIKDRYSKLRQHHESELESRLNSLYRDDISILNNVVQSVYERLRERLRFKESRNITGFDMIESANSIDVLLECVIQRTVELEDLILLQINSPESISIPSLLGGLKNRSYTISIHYDSNYLETELSTVVEINRLLNQSKYFVKNILRHYVNKYL